MAADIEKRCMNDGKLHEAEVKKSRYRGCLLGGAVGDALGYPIEFMGETSIWKKYGEKGIQTLEQAGNPAVITDDTQMTLFAANGLIYGKVHGISQWEADKLQFGEWLGTQGDNRRMADASQPKMWLYEEPRMHAWRAPGNTCLSSITTGWEHLTAVIARNKSEDSKHIDGISEALAILNNPLNSSKGCGTIMRAAPYGLIHHYDSEHSQGDDSIGVFRSAMTPAAMTHGHPMAYYSAACLSLIVWYMVQYQPDHRMPIQNAIMDAAKMMNNEAYCLLKDELQRAVDLALDPTVSDLDAIHLLGDGWVADEALYVAVFCAVRYAHDFAGAIRAAVNHGGDSDSTGAICGNILGAWLGAEAVEKAFNLEYLELTDVIEVMADDLYRAAEDENFLKAEDSAADSSAWQRYRKEKGRQV